LSKLLRNAAEIIVAKSIVLILPVSVNLGVLLGN